MKYRLLASLPPNETKTMKKMFLKSLLINNYRLKRHDDDDYMVSLFTVLSRYDSNVYFRRSFNLFSRNFQLLLKFNCETIELKISRSVHIIIIIIMQLKSFLLTWKKSERSWLMEVKCVELAKKGRKCIAKKKIIIHQHFQKWFADFYSTISFHV